VKRLFVVLSAWLALVGCDPVAAPTTPSTSPSASVQPTSAAPASTTVAPVTVTPTITPQPTTVVTTPAPPPTSAPQPQGRAYPLHTGIFSTTFWVGEIFDPKLPDGSQVCSTYDSQWALHWSGVKTGVAGSGTDCAGSPIGGCDGVPAKNKCDTEARKPDNGYFPRSASVAPKENPFYLDLPFDDINDSTGFKTRCQVIPWANDPGYAGKCSDPNFSYMKNRWVKLVGPNGNTCYGQIEDAGPSSGSAYHDTAYVFGANNAKPAHKDFNNAGLDVSPALNGCLGFKELDGENDQVSWQFVDAPPPGPWTKVVTSSGVTS